MSAENETRSVREFGAERDARLAGVARAQHGVFSVAQAAAVGVPRAVLARRVQRGSLVRLHHGVYRMTASTHTWRGDTLAACFAWGPGTVASHGCAARVWELPGYARARIELTVPRGRRRDLPHRVHHPTHRSEHAMTLHHAIPVTTVARTILDIAFRSSLDAIEEAVDDALRRRITTLPSLTDILASAAAPGRPGVVALRSALATRCSELPESVFERRLLRAIRLAGLPEPVCQHQIQRQGLVAARIDFAYPEQLVAIEADGYRWHSSRRALERDARRQSLLAAEGWRVIRATWNQLQEPHDLIAAIRGALGATSESGPRRPR
jgi:very-short-patch-repair endonuclease/predicted transcriptional regulator of viral defense system